MNFNGGNASVTEVRKSLFYHHSRHGKNADGSEGRLFSFEAIEEGQRFAGEIILSKTHSGNGESYKEILCSLLCEGDLYFGKSRSAQYGQCRLEESEFNELKMESIKKGRHAVVTFLSDALFMKEDGTYTVYEDEVREILKGRLKISEETGGRDEGEYLSFLQTSLSLGYNNAWNLRKNAVPVIRAGSAVVFHLAEDFCCDTGWVGERNLEGYGQIRVDCAEDMPYKLKPLDKDLSSEDSKLSGEPKSCEKTSSSVNTEVSEATQRQLCRLMGEVLLRSWLDKEKYAALSEKRVMVTNTALGRITLMLRESLDNHKNDPEAAFQDFKIRISSIKSDSAKREGEKLVKHIEEWRKKAKESSAAAPDAPDEIREMKSIGLTADEIHGMLDGSWGDYMMTLLTVMKYEGKTV